jgi:hypothetical protein
LQPDSDEPDTRIKVPIELAIPREDQLSLDCDLEGNEGANRWFAYPRWSKNEKVIVFYASPSLHIYHVEDGSTVKVSTQEAADCPYPHMEATLE